MFVTDSGTAEAAANILHVNGAGGTSTSAPGNSNQIVITSAPTPFTPNATLNEFDDFIGNVGGNGFKLGWTNISLSGLVDNINGTATNPGIASSKANSTSGGLYLGQLNTSIAELISSIAVGGGTLSTNWIIQLTALSSGGNTYTFQCGLADTTTLSSASNAFVSGIYFKYTNSVNGGQWTINCTSASTTTTVNTTTAAGTGFVNLGISVNAAGTSVAFTIGGVSVGTIVTNIPTAPMVPFFMGLNTAGTTPVINADLWYMSYTLTTPR